MANTISIKRKLSTGDPSAGSLAVGELCYNDVDDKLFIKNTSSAVKEIGGSAGGGTSEYMVPIWAEENSSLGNTTYEWAYGNGANTPVDGGVTIYVPSTHTCEVVAMSLRLGGGTATVELLKNGTLQGSAANVVLSSGQSATNELASPLSISSNDYINFRTTAAASTASPCVVTAWLKYTKI